MFMAASLIDNMQHEKLSDNGKQILSRLKNLISRSSHDNYRQAQCDRNTSALIEFVLAKAQSKGIDAGYNGAMNDGGQGALEREVEAYVAALACTAPKCWDEYVKEFNRLNDPEYSEFLRLSKKFQ